MFKLLISELRNVVDIPLHLHTHDTSSIQSATYLKAIENKIAIYAIHTALDNALEGVNSIICDALNLQNKNIKN